ncbi:MAG: 3-hydroxyacyl-ACP dehydratase [Bacteroidota bacterium]|nr:3-hydroxyacyl-ACP dehydratase [Bacteroidota bacterium]
MIASGEEIIQLIPQRPPFVMIDGLLHSDETTTRSQLAIRVDNIFVADGWLTAPGLLENIAQTAAARAGYEAKQQGGPVRIGYIGAVKNFSVEALPALGTSIETEVAVVSQVFDVSVVKGTVRQEGKLLAACEMKIFIQKQ